MAPSVSVPFTKMVGTGNDFVLVDTIRHQLSAVKTQWPKLARSICDRCYGVGADGLLVLEPSKIASARMRIFNPDGSEAEMCGNGARCVALYVKSVSVEGGGWRVKGDAVPIQTNAGVVSAEVREDRVAMCMPKPKILDLHSRVSVNGTAYELSLLDAGVPHAVLFVEDLESIDVQGIGRAIRSHHAFKPHGTNVNFVKPVDDHTIAVRTYERGVEAETLACGTGSVASAIAAVSMGRIAGFQVEHNPPRLLEEEVKYREQPRVLKQWLTPTGYQEYRSGATPASLRHAVVTVQTRSGDVLRVGFQTLIGEPNRKPQVMDVILEGDSKKVFEGIFSWQTRSG